MTNQPPAVGAVVRIRSNDIYGRVNAVGIATLSVQSLNWATLEDMGHVVFHDDVDVLTEVPATAMLLVQGTRTVGIPHVGLVRVSLHSLNYGILPRGEAPAGLHEDDLGYLSVLGPRGWRQLGLPDHDHQPSGTPRALIRLPDVGFSDLSATNSTAYARIVHDFDGAGYVVYRPFYAKVLGLPNQSATPVPAPAPEAVASTPSIAICDVVRARVRSDGSAPIYGTVVAINGDSVRVAVFYPDIMAVNEVLFSQALLERMLPDPLMEGETTIVYLPNGEATVRQNRYRMATRRRQLSGRPVIRDGCVRPGVVGQPDQEWLLGLPMFITGPWSPSNGSSRHTWDGISYAVRPPYYARLSSSGFSIDTPADPPAATFVTGDVVRVSSLPERIVPGAVHHGVVVDDSRNGWCIVSLWGRGRFHHIGFPTDTLTKLRNVPQRVSTGVRPDPGLISPLQGKGAAITSQETYFLLDSGLVVGDLTVFGNYLCTVVDTAGGPSHDVYVDVCDMRVRVSGSLKVWETTPIAPTDVQDTDIRVYKDDEEFVLRDLYVMRVLDTQAAADTPVEPVTPAVETEVIAPPAQQVARSPVQTLTAPCHDTDEPFHITVANGAITLQSNSYGVLPFLRVLVGSKKCTATGPGGYRHLVIHAADDNWGCLADDPEMADDLDRAQAALMDVLPETTFYVINDIIRAHGATRAQDA